MPTRLLQNHHMKISVFHNKKIPGLKRLSDLQDHEIVSRVLAEPVDLEVALEREWSTDAHFVMYYGEDEDNERLYARINKRDAFVQQLEQGGGRVVVHSLVFDHDLPKLEDGSKQEWSADSLESFLGDLQEAIGDSNLEPSAWYTTLHGSRFVYVLTEPVGRLDAEAMMLGIMDEFSKRGIELDEACSDWTRLFRLPNVEREGHGKYESQVITGGPKLDPAGVPRGEVQPDELQGEVDQYVGAMPDPDECLALLQETKENGRVYKSELVKRAKIMLAGRDSFAVVFEHAPIVRGDSNWNNQVLRVVSSVVGMMSEEECTSPEGCYALLHAAVQDLQDRERDGANTTDWFDLTWDLVTRMWSKEEAKLEARRAEHILKQAQAKTQRGELLDNLRVTQPKLVPEDKEEAQQWFARRMVASDGSRHYVMRSDGNYNLNPCPDKLLIPMIRRLHMEELIPVTEIRGKSVANRSVSDIIADHAMPIIDIAPSVRTEVAYIDGEPGYDRLYLPVHRLNPKLKPKWDDRVDAWLTAMGGEKAELLKEWIAHSLDVKRAICALNLYGVPGTGKGMLATGLAECFESERANDHKALGLYNGGLLDSPIVNCDEGVPNINSSEALSLDQAFRSLVTGGNVTIRKMRTDPFSADIYPRIMFTSNDRDIIRAIVGNRDLTDADTEAIELRLLSLEVDNAAQRLLTSKGNYAYTTGWVSGERESDYILANHIYYMYLNRQPSQTSSGRLLVEGEVGTRLVKDMRMSTRSSETVLRSIVKLIDSSHSGGGGGKVAIDKNKSVYMTAAGVADYAENNIMALNGLSLKAAGNQLRRFSLEPKKDKRDKDGRTKKTCKNGMRGRWFELDLAAIYEQTLVHGISGDQVRRLLLDQPNGLEIAEAVEDAFESEQ